MDKALLLMACFAIAGCAGSETSPAAAQSGGAAATPSEALADARQVDVRSFTEQKPACRRETPTGSLIAVRRCDTSSPVEKEFAEQIARDDMRAMQEQQMLEAARQMRESVLRQQRMPREGQ